MEATSPQPHLNATIRLTWLRIHLISEEFRTVLGRFRLNLKIIFFPVSLFLMSQNCNCNLKFIKTETLKVSTEFFSDFNFDKMEAKDLDSRPSIMYAWKGRFI